MPAPSPAPETSDERIARNFAMLRRLAELNMQAAEAAAAQITTPTPDATPAPELPAEPGATTPNPYLDLARATRAVTQVIALENRIAAGGFAPAPQPHASQTRATQPGAPLRPTVFDPRRAGLRQALHKSVENEPDRTLRTKLRTAIDQQLDDELAADPDQELRSFDILNIVAEELGLHIDVTKLSDEILGLAPKPHPADLAAHERPPLWAPAFHRAAGPDPPTDSG